MAADAAQIMAQDTRSDSGDIADTPEHGGIDLTAQQRDTAQYVADMILEMRNMAKAARLFTITVPLEYAYYEAFSIANRVEVPPEELERLKRLAKLAQESEAVVAKNF